MTCAEKNQATSQVRLTTMASQSVEQEKKIQIFTNSCRIFNHINQDELLNQRRL